MSNSLSENKKEIENKLSELRLKRKVIVSRFKKKLEEVKIEKIKNDILRK